MTPATTLTTPVNSRPPSARRELRAARFARYGSPDEPPAVDDLVGDDAELIDQLFLRAADCSSVPAIAMREIIENLVHADFEGACVSVLDEGATVRVSDCGPGIPDKELALQPGFSTAGTRLRAVVRGVGSGLHVAANSLQTLGGTMVIADNLDRGTVVTLRAPEGVTVTHATELTEHARRMLALLVEIGSATPEALAEELSLSPAVCGRELVLLEHRGLVTRRPGGERELTDDGTALLATLF